jgi:S1 RNA binding domain
MEAGSNANNVGTTHLSAMASGRLMKLLFVLTPGPLVVLCSSAANRTSSAPILRAPQRAAYRRAHHRYYASGQNIDRGSPELVVGATVEGIVTRTATFGAFVSLPGYGRDGLVHISELANRYVVSVEEFIHIGDRVVVKILGVDGRGRISLSLKQAELTGNARKVELGGDWGHPWNDDGETRWANLGPRPCRTHYPWEPDPCLFTFDHRQFRDQPFDPAAGHESA